MNEACYIRHAEWPSNLLATFSVHSHPTLAFQGEKDFSIQVKTNRQNDRVYGHGLKNQFIM